MSEEPTPAVAAGESPGRPEPVVRGYVMSRGYPRQADYRFLGAAPDPGWWTRHRSHTDVNYPTLLVEARGGRWRAYLSGIPSQRRDEVSTPIRFTLALEGATASGGADGVVRLVARWLDGHADGSGRAVLGERMDGLFPDDAEVVDLQRRHDVEAVGVVQDRMERLLTSLEAPGGPEPTEWADRSWIASAADGPGAAAFVERVRALLAGEQDGDALVLNLVEQAEEAPPVAAGESLAVLTATGGPDRPRALPAAIPGQSGDQGPKAPGRTTPASPVDVRRALPLVLAALLLVLLILWCATR
ncbi:hypothetical protein ACFQ1I_09530 [Kitasatospora arboriphila]